MPLPGSTPIDPSDSPERNIARIYVLHAWGFAGSHVAVAIVAVWLAFAVSMWIGAAVFVANGGPAVAAAVLWWHARRMRRAAQDRHTRHVQGAIPTQRRVLPNVPVDEMGHPLRHRHGR